jgi:hypothetical protein
MPMTFEESVRRRVEHALEPTIAARAGLTVPLLQQFTAYALEPSEDALVALALQLQVSIPEDVLGRWSARKKGAA